ncbi:hypothetical protein PG994_003514 [Apiospora phragmitis]|uniref:Uncharacterized protein n=1 Tax=Apiospora phragmitis TaxID=2905665 RepID=A0ABR1VYG7_9PEZI
MSGSKRATLVEVKPAHDASPGTSGGLPKKPKKQTNVIDLVSDSEDDGTPPPLATALKRRSSKISGSREANPRPIKKPTPALRAPTAPNPIVRKTSSMPNGKTTHGDTVPASRFEAAQKQTRLANSTVADLKAEIEGVKAELLATKNTLSHRDAEVDSYKRMEAEFVRTKGMLSKQEAELDKVTQEKTELTKQVEQVTAENEQLSNDLADTVRDAHEAGRMRDRLAAGQAEQLEMDALLLEYRDKITKMAKMEDELEELRKACAVSVALYASHKDEFEHARDAHGDLKNERDAAIALAESHKEHIDAFKKSLTLANKSLDRARTDESAQIARIDQIEGEIQDLETIRDGLESTNEEIMAKLGSAEAEKRGRRGAREDCRGEKER